MRHSNAKGFTLIELLLVIALILIVSVPATSFYTRFIYQMAVDDANEGLIGMFQEAQVYALSGKENCSWGVKYESSRFIMFCGNSFSERNTAFDQILEINSNLSVSGLDETVFQIPSGCPTIPLTNISISKGNIEKIISLNAEGAVE